MDLFKFIINDTISIKTKLEFAKTVNRTINIINIGLKLDDVLLGIEIEMSIFEFATLYIINNHHEHYLFSSVYEHKTKNVIDNIMKNPILMKDIKLKNINPRVIAFMSPDQLNPVIWKDILDKQIIKEERANNIPTTDIYLCRRCGARKSTTKVIQTRAIDEALTTIVICCKCHNTFTV